MNTIYVKNMVCNRCIKVVREELEKIGVKIKTISLGEIEAVDYIDKLQLDEIKRVLEKNGFELLEDKKAKIIEKIKNHVIKLVHYRNEELSENFKYSVAIEKELGLDYNYLSNLFSSLEGITIEQYIIFQKIEKAKELLKYDELTLSEIAYKLGYSSVQHLSNQFKKVTGMTASKFKDMANNTRKPLDNIS